MIMILTANGALDTTFNTTGYKIYKFDATNDRADESLYGAAVSPNGMFAVAAGYRNAGTVAGNNDDAVLVILPLGGTGTEFAAAVAVLDDDRRSLLGGHLRRRQQDRRRRLRHRGDGRLAGGGALQHRRHTATPTSATDGIAKVNATVGGTLEEARGVVVQSDGKIVIGGTAEH